MKITKKDAKIIRNLKPATERILSLFEVILHAGESKATVKLAANDEVEAVQRVRRIYAVDRLEQITNLGYVRVPA
jgi:hypothetical protein